VNSPASLTDAVAMTAGGGGGFGFGLGFGVVGTDVAAGAVVVGAVDGDGAASAVAGA